LLISFLFCLIAINSSNSENKNDIYKKIDLFSEVLDKINKEYYGEVNLSDTMDAAINGALQSLDPYSAYMSPKAYEQMQTDTRGEFPGLGIEVSMQNGLVKVISPMEDTPAYDAGVKAGDYIVKINGKQVQGMTLDEAVSLMRGPVDTEVNITIRRIGVKEAINFDITRKKIQIPSVKAEVKNNNVGYLRLKAFNENSSEQLKKKIIEVNKNNELNAYILDLRNNPGGLLTQATTITDFFLDNGEIVSVKGKKQFQNKKWFAKKGDLTKGKVLVVLINYGSASASEIVAGALKDHKRAILIGEKSYGKGSVQIVLPLKNNGAIRLTSQKYYLPSGQSISESGVDPDIVVAESSDKFKLNTETDNQLNYTLKLLNE
jgi:carboxyl-terminal processing protease